jgi:hypothetical protein
MCPIEDLKFKLIKNYYLPIELGYMFAIAPIKLSFDIIAMHNNLAHLKASTPSYEWQRTNDHEGKNDHKNKSSVESISWNQS